MKKTQINHKTIIFIFLLLIIFFSPLKSVAVQPCTIRGYVYINDVITKPDELILVFPSQTVYAELYSDGYYIIDCNEDIDQIGEFYVTYLGQTLLAQETATILYDVYMYQIDIHVSSSFNNPPNTPINPTPANNSENIALNPTISVYVTDPDGDTMTVSFYNALNDNLIGSSIIAEHASTASNTWTELAYNETYSWYAVSNDSQYETKSDVFSFKTKTEENQPPAITIIKPKLGELYINDRPILSNFFQIPLIVGDITVQINAADSDSGIDRVEITISGFLMDDELFILTDEPYEIFWDKFGFGRYLIKAVAYDSEGESKEDSITVRKFF